MKDLFRAWRWSNLFSFSCWKYGLKNALFLFAASLCIILYLFRTEQDDSLFFAYLFAGIAFLLLLSYVCCGIDRFIVSTDWSYLRVFIYPYKDNKYKMIIKSRYAAKTIYIEEYERSKERIIQHFIYTEERGKWIFQSANIQKAIGKKIGENVFLSTSTEDEKAVISIVNRNQAVAYSCDFFVYNDFYRPKNMLKDNTSNPDEYLLIRNKDKYQMIGIYLRANQVYEIHPPVVIFDEVGDMVILIYNSHDQKYTEIHRKEIKQFGNIRIRKTKDYIVGGKVFLFDQETQSYQQEYEGRIFGIDPTKNYLIGEKGWSTEINLT